jgi:hypothetical protein
MMSLSLLFKSFSWVLSFDFKSLVWNCRDFKWFKRSVWKDWKVCGFKVTAEVVLWWVWVSMRSLIIVAVRSSLMLKCMINRGIVTL